MHHISGDTAQVSGNPANVVFAAVIATILVVLSLSACGSSEDGVRAVATSAREVTSASTGPTETVPGPRTLRGITFLVCNGPQQSLTVYNVDPSDGVIDEVGTWSWIQLDYTPEGPAFGCGGTGVRQDGWLNRQQFNTDFSEMAVTQGGIVAIQDAQGDVRDIGAPASTGYGAQTPAEYSPLFQPGTETVWYADQNQDDSLFSVDTTDPDAMPTAEDGTAGEVDAAASGTSYLFPIFNFSPDGDVVVTGVPPNLGALLMAPSGDFGVHKSLSYLVATRQQATSPGGHAYARMRELADREDSEDCTPKVFVSDVEALCSAYTSNIYRLTFTDSFTSYTSEPLLPAAAEVEDGSIVASPDGVTVAFVSRSAGHIGLFTVDITSGGQPTEVADLDALSSNVRAFSLLDWQ